MPKRLFRCNDFPFLCGGQATLCIIYGVQPSLSSRMFVVEEWLCCFPSDFLLSSYLKGPFFFRTIMLIFIVCENFILVSVCGHKLMGIIYDTGLKDSKFLSLLQPLFTWWFCKCFLYVYGSISWTCHHCWLVLCCWRTFWPWPWLPTNRDFAISTCLKAFFGFLKSPLGHRWYVANAELCSMCGVEKQWCCFSTLYIGQYLKRGSESFCR